jgi:hypothetical protein
MSEFLKEWDQLIADARKTGVEQWLFRVNSEVPYDWTPVARTMHPSFMASAVPKHDPERDK